MNLTGKVPSQMFMGLRPAMCLDMMRTTNIWTGIIGRASWAMVSRGTPNPTNFSL